MTTWLDRAIGWFSPSRALNRAQARRRLDLLASYEGAKRGRRTEGWVATGTSANAELREALSMLRQRSRDVVRNNPYASKALRALRAHSVGTGIVPNSSSDKANDLFGEWSSVCDADGVSDFHGIVGLVATTIFESGEVLVRKRFRRPDDALPVPLQLQVLEPDHLDERKNELLPSGGRIVSGVEIDPIGGRSAYWLFPFHPGDSGLAFSDADRTSRRIDADRVVHAFQRTRPGQVRGAPWFAPSLISMRDLDDYEDAEAMRKKIEACNVGVVTRPDGLDGQPLGERLTDQPEGANAPPVDWFEPGSFHHLRPGEMISFNDPRSNTAYESYVRTRLHAIAAGIGVTYHQLTGDLREANYSSMRGGLIDFWAMVEEFRWTVLVHQVCDPIWRTWVSQAVLAGALTEQDREAALDVKWSPPRFQSVDPLKDAQAIVLRVRSGLDTLQQAIAEQGWEPAQQLVEIAATNQMLDTLGIVLDTDPRKVAKSGAVQSENEPEQEAA